MADPSPHYQLEQVFNEATTPTVTFVPPKDWKHVRASLRAPGKHVTIIGPSGSGKSTLALRALQEEGVKPADVLSINGRFHKQTPTFIEVVERELQMPGVGRDGVASLLKSLAFVFVDDFHHMSVGARDELTSLLKPWGELGIRFVTVGIAASAAQLLGSDAELGIRNDPYKLTKEEAPFIETLIGQGEKALKISFGPKTRASIVAGCRGVPSVVQAICRIACIERDVKETVSDTRTIDVELKDIRDAVLRSFEPKYFDRLVGLCKGKKQARSVHHTYFDIVSVIAASGLAEVPLVHIRDRIVGPVTDKAAKNRKAMSYYNCLRNFKDVITSQALDDVLIYNDKQNAISIEDPSFWFYLGLVDLERVRKLVRIRKTDYPYDVAISFAGEDRATAEKIVREMQELGLEVFYDFDQQQLLWGKDLRQKLGEVYANEALYMLVLVSKDYPEKDWTSFELEIGKAAAKKRTGDYLLPVRIDDTPIVGLKDDVGRLDVRQHDPKKIATLLSDKIESAEGTPAPTT